MDVAQFPGDQHTHEQCNGQSYPKCEGIGHPFVGALGVFGVLATPHHVQQGCRQTADNRDESKCNKNVHGSDYPVNGAGLGGRFWLVTTAAVAAVTVTTALGLWQLDRGAQKTRMQDAIEARQNLPAVDGRSLRAQGVESLLHRRVELRGTWIAGSTVFLDNRQMNGRPGFYVVTAMQVDGLPEAVLVQRGWVPRNFVDRGALPSVETPGGAVFVEGRLTSGPSRLYELAPTTGGLIRQNLDVSAFATEIRRPLLALAVLETSARSDGLLRQWPVIGTGVEKHHGYAAQWFGLSGLIAILYVWFQIVRRFQTRARTS